MRWGCSCRFFHKRCGKYSSGSSNEGKDVVRAQRFLQSRRGCVLPGHPMHRTGKFQYSGTVQLAESRSCHNAVHILGVFCWNRVPATVPCSFSFESFEVVKDLARPHYWASRHLGDAAALNGGCRHIPLRVLHVSSPWEPGALSWAVFEKFREAGTRRPAAIRRQSPSPFRASLYFPKDERLENGYRLLKD